MPRRLLAAAVCGALALAGLTACREEPTLAASVGSARLTIAQVESMVDAFTKDVKEADQAARPAAPPAPSPSASAGPEEPLVATGSLRQLIVSLFVMRELAGQMAAEHGISAPAVDPKHLADSMREFHLPAAQNDPVVRLLAERDMAFEAIRGLVTPQPLTDAELREVFDILVAEGAVPPGGFELAKTQFDTPGLRLAFAQRAALRDATTRHHLDVNPRYRPLLFAPVGLQFVVSLEPATPAAVLGDG
jgi:hypothetical protein